MALYDMKAAAEAINFNGGRNKLIKFLKEKFYLNTDNTPVPELREKRLLISVPRTAFTAGGMQRQYYKTVATSEGLTWLENLCRTNDMLKH
ncbi:hypothetical protein [Aliamphritea hakodatensis]|uniref:hypothetical protein n=1 Tax=Aliamphritea hakodatensis TaxID=2895352 RepID=UPI0022FDA26A|nr:hypothetical protein [Aliamphritea hakodatensis]